LAPIGYIGSKIYAGSMRTDSWSSWWGVLSSNDTGTTWEINNDSLVPPATSVYSLACYNDTNCFYFCGTNQGVYRQIVGIQNWERYKPGILDAKKVNDLHISYFGSSYHTELFACTDYGAYLLSGYPDNPMDEAEWKNLDLNKKILCAYAFSQYNPSFWLVGTGVELLKGLIPM
jgi:hypothetical protein